jgi:hypothetical protein
MRMGSVDMATDFESLRVHLGLSESSILGHSNSGSFFSISEESKVETDLGC